MGIKIVKLTGRIGNQMFIYAFARALEHYSGDEVFFDTSYFNNNQNHLLELESLFNINLKVAPAKMIEKVKNRGGVFKCFLGNKVKEKDGVFEPNLLKKKGDRYYSGYFQCEKYFKEIEPCLREDFKFKPVCNEVLLKLRGEIENLEYPVFINVRRGDYVTLQAEGKIDWLCDISYYRQAAKLMAEKYPNCTFIAVSDEPEWLKEHLDIEYPFKVYSTKECAPGLSYDIFLLQACKSGICANSSYSWWAGWLIDNPEKTIIAPSPWFEPFRKTDIIPDTWVKLPRY